MSLLNLDKRNPFKQMRKNYTYLFIVENYANLSKLPLKSLDMPSPSVVFIIFVILIVH